MHKRCECLKWTFPRFKVHTVSLLPRFVSECQSIVIGISYTAGFTIDHNRSSRVESKLSSRLSTYRGTNTSESSTFPPPSCLISQWTRFASITKSSHYFSENITHTYPHICVYVNIYCTNCISSKQAEFFFYFFLTFVRYCISLVTHSMPSITFRSFTMASLRK